jgi:hypothetical protein
MPFSKTHQPRYAVYIVRGARHILVGRYGSLARALHTLAVCVEMGEMGYHDVNS